MHCYPTHARAWHYDAATEAEHAEIFPECVPEPSSVAMGVLALVTVALLRWAR